MHDTETLIVGAGPAGLAAAACLRERDLPFEIVERDTTIASTWRRHYDRLHLHTVKDWSALPHMGWPKEMPRFPSKDELVAYAEAYARRFEVAPHFGTEVSRARRDGDRWVVETARGAWRSKNLVIATGYNRVALRPSLPAESDFGGTVLHSSEYRNGAAWKGKRVLVVGSGNSGGELALDLLESGAEVGWVVRGPMWVAPIEKWGIANQVNSVFLSVLPLWLADAIAQLILRVTVGDLSRYGIVRPEMGPLEMIWKHGRVPILDVGTIARVKSGEITVHPGAERFTRSGVVFADGSERPFDLVLFATGFRPVLEGFLEPAEAVCDERGRPRWHGTRAGIDGLYFIGFRNPPTGALREMAREGIRIAREIARA